MRIFATCLGFNTPEMIRGALENFEATTTDVEHRRLVKTLFLCQFPFPTPEKNRHALLDIGAEFGWWTTEIPNEGGLANHNRVIHEYYRMRPGDLYICFDPDVRMQQTGWVSAMAEALASDPSAVFCCAARPFHDEEWCVRQHGRSISVLPSGLRVARYRQLIAWSTGIWKGEWLAARPRDFKAANQWYGYFEHADLALMNAKGKTWLQVPDYYDHHQGADADYTKWKIESARGETKVSFEEWLKKKKPSG